MASDSHERVNNRAGLCARKVCAASLGEHENMRHKHSGYLYCRPCARAINKACGEQLVVRDFPEEAR